MGFDVTPLGFKKPDGNDPVRNGDNHIADNAQKADDILVVIKAQIANLLTAAGFPVDPIALNDDAVAAALALGGSSSTAMDTRLGVKVPPLVAAYIAADPSVVTAAATMAQNTAGLVPVWKASTAYVAGQRVINPDGDIVAAVANFTSGTTYNAANWVTSVARWVKPALTTGTDLNTLTTPGVYPVATGSVASSLVNAPGGFVNPGSVTVIQASASNNVTQQIVRMYWTGGLTRVFTRQSLGGTFPTTWESEKPFMGTVTNATDWNTVVAPGVYSLDNFTNSNTMTNLPPVSGGFAGTITVTPITSTRVAQVGIEYATSNPGKVWQRVNNTNGTFTTWEPVAGQVTALGSGQDLNTLLTPGKYRTETSAIATSTLNNPGVVNPFLITVDRISTGNGVYLQTLAEWSATGPIISRRISLSGVFQPWVTDPGAGSRAAFDAWGDSLTEGGGIGETWLTSEAWPARMATLLGGTTVTNRGRSGDTTDEILIRMGVHQLYFTVTGGSIPASGAVAVVTKMKTFIPRDRNYTGSIAGVPGTLSFTFSTGTWSFTRTTSGTAVTVSGSVPFISGQTLTKTNPFVFWAGRNDWDFNVTGLDLSLSDHILANHRKVLDFLPAGEKRVIFFGPTLRSTETVGTAGYNRVWGLINQMKYLFPGTFYCVMDYLIDHALDDAGITKTSADLAAIANREAPPSLFITGDTTHFRKEIADVVGRLFAAPIVSAKGFVN